MYVQNHLGIKIFILHILRNWFQHLLYLVLRVKVLTEQTRNKEKENKRKGPGAVSTHMRPTYLSYFKHIYTGHKCQYLDQMGLENECISSH